MAEFQLSGVPDLVANLESLNVSVHSAARGACNAAAQTVKNKAIENARAQGLVSTGALVNNIAVKYQRGTPPEIVEYHVGVRHGREAKGAEKIAVRGSDGKIRYQYTDDPFYWWFWEVGYVTRSGRHIAARPFLRPALLSQEGALAGVMQGYLAARLEKTVLKAIS